MAVLALLAFAGQAYAAVNFPCTGMDNHSTSAMMAGEMDMDHGSHAQPDASDGSAATDCCSHEQCSQAGCNSATVAVVGTHSPFPGQCSQTLNTDYSASCLLAEISLPFRPPISR
jgi:hypothetical protein